MAKARLRSALALCLFAAACFPAQEKSAQAPLLLSAEIVPDGGELAVAGKTNLPDGTRLKILLTRMNGDPAAGDIVTVTSGRFQTRPFSDQGWMERYGASAGLMDMTITSDVEDQPDSVAAALEGFSGPDIDRGDDGTHVVHRQQVTLN